MAKIHLNVVEGRWNPDQPMSSTVVIFKLTRRINTLTD